jgi:hypothetical protein
MRKIDTLLNHNSQLSALTKNVQSHQLLQKFWVAASPQMLSNSSFVGSLVNGQLTVYAHSAIVANKIKLTIANLLTQLQNLQQSNPNFRECKVTAIMVKVQVKSHPKTPAKRVRKLSKNAADSLKKLALDLGDSALSNRLNSLASKISQ